MTKPFVFLFLFIDTGEAEAEEINSKLLNRESGINQKARKQKQIKSNNKNMCLAAEYRQVHKKKREKREVPKFTTIYEIFHYNQTC